MPQRKPYTLIIGGANLGFFATDKQAVEFGRTYNHNRIKSSDVKVEPLPIKVYREDEAGQTLVHEE
jgi:hypothetical protein